MKRTRIFWTCILPENLIARHGLSFAACNFSFNLMSGNGFDKVYSSMPLYVNGEMEKEAFKDERFELVYDSWRKGKGILYKLATFREQWSIFKRIPRNASVWLYNLNTLNALLFVLLKIFKPSVQLNVIVLDFTPVTKGFGLNRIYLKLINSASGRICLANSSLFKSENSIVLPGVVPDNNEIQPRIETSKKSFLLSGVLSEEISQLALVLNAFSQLPDCDLHITGKTENKELIEKYANKYNNIHWYGMLSFGKYQDLMHGVTFQLSTRNPDYPENKCNFPSKIIEALLHNRIIVSTIHYPQIDGVNYFEVSSEKKKFASAITEIANMSANELMQYANQGDKVKKMFSTEVWKEAMDCIENNNK